MGACFAGLGCFAPGRVPVKLMSTAQLKDRPSIAEKPRILIFGNPGKGKSTVLNCLLECPQFVSDISFDGQGVTERVHWVHFDDLPIVFGDSPGLRDPTLREQAAAEITEGLRAGGRYHLLFVVGCSSGRVDVEDMVTTSLILRALQIELQVTTEELRYAIILNKLEPQILDKHKSDVHVRTTFWKNLFVGNCEFSPPPVNTGITSLPRTKNILKLAMDGSLDGRSKFKPAKQWIGQNHDGQNRSLYDFCTFDIPEMTIALDNGAKVDETCYQDKVNSVQLCLELLAQEHAAKVQELEAHCAQAEDEARQAKENEALATQKLELAQNHVGEMVPNVVMVGNCGTGKSTCMEKLSGTTGLAGDSMIAITKLHNRLPAKDGSFCIVDTPGQNALTDRMQDNLQVAMALNQGPVSLMLITTKADNRLEEVVEHVEKYIERFIDFVEVICILVTCMDQPGRQWSEKDCRDILSDQFGLNKVIFSGLDTSGEQLIQSVRAELVEPRTFDVAGGGA